MDQTTSMKSEKGVLHILYNINLTLKLKFIPEDLKFVTQQRAYPIWSLGAEIDGYLGMFLGYSLLQLTQLVCGCLEVSGKLAKQLHKQLF